MRQLLSTKPDAQKETSHFYIAENPSCLAVRFACRIWALADFVRHCNSAPQVLDLTERLVSRFLLVLAVLLIAQLGPSAAATVATLKTKTAPAICPGVR